MELSPLQLLAANAGSATFGGGLSSLFNWLSKKGRDQAYARGLVDRAMEGALTGVSEQLKRADERLRSVEQHRDECNEELEAGKTERAELMKRIDELMKGPVAGYAPRVPK